jgi:hypothetical protein
MGQFEMFVCLRIETHARDRPTSQDLSLLLTIVCESFIPFKVEFLHCSGPIAVAAFVPNMIILLQM